MFRTYLSDDKRQDCRVVYVNDKLLLTEMNEKFGTPPGLPEDGSNAEKIKFHT